MPVFATLQNHDDGSLGAADEAASHREILNSYVVTRASHTASRGLPASFIRRCIYHFRKARESSICGDLRMLWNKREMVKELPEPALCGRPKYIVTDADLSLRNGIFGDKHRLETLQFPGEKWHKCCLTRDGDGNVIGMKCQATPVIDHRELLTEHNGWCGVNYCVGSRDRCLVVDHRDEPDFRADPKKLKRGIKQCPKGCPKSCHRESMRLDCVYIGEEPRWGSESVGVQGNQQLETPTVQFGEAMPYEVYALSAPSPAMVCSMAIALKRAMGGDARPRRSRDGAGDFL